MRLLRATIRVSGSRLLIMLWAAWICSMLRSWFSGMNMDIVWCVQMNRVWAYTVVGSPLPRQKPTTFPGSWAGNSRKTVAPRSRRTD